VQDSSVVTADAWPCTLLASSKDEEGIEGRLHSQNVCRRRAALPPGAAFFDTDFETSHKKVVCCAGLQKTAFNDEKAVSRLEKSDSCIAPF
jgi:hypothetical protein